MDGIVFGNRMKYKTTFYIGDVFPQANLHGPFGPAKVLKPARAL